MSELNNLTIKEASEGLENKDFSAEELTKDCLSQIDNRNNEINAFISINSKAVEEAKCADKIISSGEGTVLTGIPFSVKDAICVKGIRATGGSKILDNYTAPYNASVITKLQNRGGIMIGKNNCDAFGHGASNENSMYGPVKNPHFLKKVAGGSSGGSAASVADNECLYSIAEDTGGSIRQPASFCGVVGLRPSYGRNSRFGIMPMASSFDTVGPITKTVEDMAFVAQAIAGIDSRDATTTDQPVKNYFEELKKDLRGITIGIPKEYYEVDGIDPEVQKIAKQQIQKLKDLGCKIKDVSLPHTKYAIATYYILVPSEDSSNMARLDGIRYGVRAETDNLFDLYSKTREVGFPDEVKRRILIGTYALSAGYYDAYYKKAQKVRALIKQDFDIIFKEVDALFTPTSPFPAFNINEKINNTLEMYLSDVMLSPAAVAGVPAISVPVAKTSLGLPVGMQLIGNYLREDLILRIGHWLEKAV